MVKSEMGEEMENLYFTIHHSPFTLHSSCERSEQRFPWEGRAAGSAGEFFYAGEGVEVVVGKGHFCLWIRDHVDEGGCEYLGFLSWSSYDFFSEHGCGGHANGAALGFEGNLGYAIVFRF